jgi:5-methylcytosine-specific restriction endonuclease McrA
LIEYQKEYRGNTMSKEKKLIRKKFRDACYKRDNYKCVMCSFTSSITMCEQELDVHHITNPKKIPNGGYVLENGITLCEEDHKKAEVFHSTGTSHPGYSPEDLYVKINSNLEKAVDASKKLS